MGNADAGWYDDGSGRQRWWDGTAWTEHFADANASADVVTVTQSSPPATSRPANWYDDGRGRLRWWDGNAWTAQTRFSGNEHGFAGVVVDGAWIHYRDNSQPIAGAIATIETAGEIGSRSTLTRAAAGGILLGPAGLIAGAMFKKNVDRRELYLTIEGPEAVWIAPIAPKLGGHARQFAAWVNTVSRHYLRNGG